MTTERKAAGNKGFAKLAVQCSADTFVANQILFSSSTFVVKIATFAKPETVLCNKQLTLNKNEKHSTD
jgi:hypothetical protein